MKLVELMKKEGRFVRASTQKTEIPTSVGEHVGLLIPVPTPESRELYRLAMKSKPWNAKEANAYHLTLSGHDAIYGLVLTRDSIPLRPASIQFYKI